MTPTKNGQIVKFKFPLADEDPSQLYVILEIKLDGEKSRADIQPLGTGLRFPGINTVLVRDLEIVEVSTTDLLGHKVTVQMPDYSEKTGEVVDVKVQKIELDLTRGITGIETNVWLTVKDDDGNEHYGTLVVR